MNGLCTSNVIYSLQYDMEHNPVRENEHMTDNELLLAISNMMDTKSDHITKDVTAMKQDISIVKKVIEEHSEKLNKIA